MGILFNVADFLLAIAVLFVLLVWELVKFIFHPLWYPVLIWTVPQKAAQIMYNDLPYDGLKWSWANACITKVQHFFAGCMKAWLPLVALQSMKKRKFFIDKSNKKLCDYNVKTQLKYFAVADEEQRKNLIKFRILSEEATEMLWSKNKEFFIECGKLSEKQIDDLINSNSKLLAKYLLKYTPSEELLNKIVLSHADAIDAVVQYIKKHRPSGLLVCKLLNIYRGTAVATTVEKIVRSYADEDAVAGNSSSTEDVAAWNRYCQHHNSLCSEAQKKMAFWQYKIFAQTDHHLDSNVLPYMLATVSDANYMEAICRHEFKRLSGNNVSILQSEGWRYAIYLKVASEDKG